MYTVPLINVSFTTVKHEVTDFMRDTKSLPVRMMSPVDSDYCTFSLSNQHA